MAADRFVDFGAARGLLDGALERVLQAVAKNLDTIAW